MISLHNVIRGPKQPIPLGPPWWHHLTRESASLKESGLDLPTSCQTGRAPRSARPESSRRRCWFHQTGRAERSWRTRCCQKTGRNSWRRRWRWSRLQTNEEQKKLLLSPEKMLFYRQKTKCLPIIPNILKRPILSMSSADTMLPGNTAKVPRKLTK